MLEMNIATFLFLGGSSSCMTSSPWLMVFAIFFNMTVVCLQRGNTFVPCDTTYSRNTTKGSQAVVKSLIIILLRMQKQTKRFYSNLLSHFFIPLLPITFMKLTRLVSSKHRIHPSFLSFNGRERCTDNITNNIEVKWNQILEMR